MVQLIILGILWYGEVTSYIYAIYSSICITAIFMLIGKVQLWLQEHINSIVPFGNITRRGFFNVNIDGWELCRNTRKNKDSCNLLQITEHLLHIY